MPAFAALTLQNNALANVIFNPQSIDSNGIATFLTGDAILDAKSKVTSSISLPKNGSNVSRVKQKVVVPIMDTVDPSKKATEAYVNIEYVLPKQASETQRLDLRKYVSGLVLSSITTAAVQSLEAVY